ncbi:MAG: mreC [Myxococcaceae bacterium]|nr:mreC [Myxococcaceae bacterium]
MFSLLKRYRDVLLVTALLLYPLGTYLSSGHRGRDPNFVDRAVLWIAAPIQGGLTAIATGLGDAVSGYVALRGSHEEALACRSALAETRAELHTLREAEGTNARLKAMLGYVESTVEPEIAARVIGINLSPHFLSMRINRGEDDAVRKGMPVVTPEGVVGQVVSAVGGSADVMLVSDPASRVGVTIQRSRVRATAVGVGDGKSLALDNAARGDDVIDGDLVITSGTDGVFPQGLVIGKIEDVRRVSAGMFLSASVAPAVNLRGVEEVLVVPLTASAPPAALLPTTRPR